MLLGSKRPNFCNKNAIAKYLMKKFIALVAVAVTLLAAPLSVVQAVTIDNLPEDGGLVFESPVRSRAYWRNTFYSQDNHFGNFINFVVPGEAEDAEPTEHAVTQCVQWDEAQTVYTLYFEGTSPVSFRTFTSGPLNGCTRFEAEETVEARLAACSAAADVADCEAATIVDGYWLN